MSLVGPPNIEKLAARSDVEGLVKVLSHNEAKVTSVLIEDALVVGRSCPRCPASHEPGRV